MPAYVPVPSARDCTRERWFRSWRVGLACYKPDQRHERAATWSEGTPDGRWRPYSYEAITARDKASLDIFWLRDETLDDSATLPAPGVLAAEIVEDLRAVLAQFQEIGDDLGVEILDETEALP